MILKGSQRGGARDLALHLMKDENDHVELHELRGFASENLVGALNEAYAQSRGTRCAKFLYSLSLNPPPSEHVSTRDFEAAINMAEERLGLSGQPRAIVFHEKEGRRHAHAVWSRIDAQRMKAVQLSFDHRKLNAVSRELFLEHGWQMPRGLAETHERDPKNFTLEEWQQAKRAGRDVAAIKSAFQDSWAISDSRQAFASALETRGFKLAKGDRRGFVGVNRDGEAYAVSKWVGVKARDVRARLGEPDTLPSVTERHAEHANEVNRRLNELKREQDARSEAERLRLAAEKRSLIAAQRAERRFLEEQQQARAAMENTQRQERFSKGLRGLFDRITGERKRVAEQNRAEAYDALLRDRHEKDALIFRHLDERKALDQRRTVERERQTEVMRELRTDIRQQSPQKDLNEARREELAEKREQLQRSRARREGRSLDL
ncbi:hypothetical protein PB2503_05862 [Parvularcula bermudensis HTCC2503]|uniref:MobA/VirD2-like nuclease domain-containing protein n=1 Tax=Parvularcula bermudensis (strain ATCC BAA-594 / HTCC2503 / KCTC 12087) TaxID=314260 RepID=E0TH03_PARBH|nr:relaxase/mobilization nuclease domain-containing protein [Parvularcula bermudensis]ADM09243.1 hypothetical protein PB2503_05862 [Parvularcula bermudensis HTCC2503]